MARLVLVYLGKVNGVDAYGPLDAEDERQIKGKKMFACDVKGEKCLRTTQQNKAIYKYGGLLAEQLNSGGITKQVYFDKKQVDCEWTTESVIEDIWREIQFALFGHRRTSKLEPKQVTTVYNQVSRILSEHFSISQSFPERHWQLYEQMDREAS